MRIGQLAAHTGIGVETIRFYESKGLLMPPVRLANNYREYGEEHVARLHFIRHCRALDIALDDIAKLCSIGQGDAAQLAGLHALIDTQLAAVRQRIADLNALERKLSELKSSCSGKHDGCRGCAILDGLQSYDRDGCECCRHFVDKACEAQDRTQS